MLSLFSKYFISKHELGHGANGKVFEGEERLTKKPVAIKKIKHDIADSYHAKQLFREILILRLLKGHPHIVSLEHVTLLSGVPLREIFLVFEQLGCSLDRVIASPQTLTPAHVKHFLYQILNGVDFIHSAKWVHRDLKPANLLVREDCLLKICDFGLARATGIVETAEPFLFPELTQYMVTRWYRSPELILRCRGAGDASADLWSVGCILAELILRTPLFPGASSDNVLNLILNLLEKPEPQDCLWIDDEGARRSVLEHVREPSQGFNKTFEKEEEITRSLLKELLEINPSKRITAAQAMAHPFFSEYRRQGSPSHISFNVGTEKETLDAYYRYELSRDKSYETVHTLILKELKEHYHHQEEVPVIPTPVTSSSTFSAYVNSAIFRPSAEENIQQTTKKSRVEAKATSSPGKTEIEGWVLV